MLDKHRRVVNYYLLGLGKKAACKKAGFSPLSYQDIFGRADVKEEIERRIRVSEKKTDMDREWLLSKLRIIIEAEPGELIEVDEDGRASLNFNNLSPTLRKAISKVSAESSREGGKYKRTKSHVVIDTPNRLHAIKEAAILLGLREEKTKIDLEQSLMDELTKRRDHLAKEEK
jgi:hypothetical protein